MGLSQQGSLLLSEFITRNYSRRIVEVACGRYSRVAFTLSQSVEIRATDVLESEAVDERIRPLYYKDDIMSPDLRLYQNAQLLYSIRPPLEIQHGILNVARAVHADVLVKPLSDEIIDALRAYLRNYRGIAFYHFRADAALGREER
ncbi:MAG: UPF0146 family protein [Halobacteriota archaeon]